MYVKSKQNGFTLVELSIVLVIIGLIVGGVVGGQSLIHSAMIGKITTDLHKYTTAIRTYEDAYDALPGDHIDAQDYFGTNCSAPCNGDGDGNIAGNEIYYVWPHLGLAKVLNQQYSEGRDYMGRVEVEYPEGPVTGDEGETHYILQSFTTGHGIYQNHGTYLSLVGPPSVNQPGANRSQGALSPRDAAKIDKKMDDGIAYTGKLLTTTSKWYNNWGGTCVTDAYYATVSNYTLENSEKSCQIHFKYK
jgi:prepilin-type N-terminal cleavage/methylation domain-containing protein